MVKKSTKSPTPSLQELIDMVQYLTTTNEHLVEEYRKLEKEVKQLRLELSHIVK